MTTEILRDYELVMILSPEATEEEIEATVERVKASITDRGGSVSEHETWGLRPLAFPVLKFQEGNYALTRFTLVVSAVAELNRSLSAAEDILRYLVSRA